MADTLRKAAGADGTIIAYRQYGEGPRLLTCLHSLALDSSWYSPLAEALGDDYRLLVPDFRGHGQSARGDSPLTLGLIAQDIAAMWDNENIKSSVVLGISLGGMVAQAVTGSFPDRVDAQILMATRGSYDEAAADGTRARAAEVRASGGLEAAVEMTLYRWFGDSSKDETNPLVRQARAQFLAAGGDIIAEYFEAMTQVGEFSLDSPPPTLVIGGDDDRSTPRSIIEQLASSIRDAELRIAPGGHLLAFENPYQVAAVLRPFLENLACWPR
ncbi:alpha/beta hydrolase fold family protein [Pseudarthrobacter siccitolerans]|uniref:Alpha/beta hydrolase fold family protein n=1 Tax=Pseudarthrobacter siccitolerans TaxID=861266 RepID=A0A024H336_9MICC|nr:alpha/beta fold hydrolase [Pseudarthrobacter siccitolerans]CCQ46184.1 alpha/beta hydrolase fold family protein [Pseudarthrobacter siccitolerans]